MLENKKKKVKDKDKAKKKVWSPRSKRKLIAVSS